jgi:hypothetical protein
MARSALSGQPLAMSGAVDPAAPAMSGPNATPLTASDYLAEKEGHVRCKPKSACPHVSFDIQ